MRCNGAASGNQFTRKQWICLGFAILLPFLSQLITFGGAAPKAGLALGIVASVMILMLSGVTGIGASGALICAAGILTGLLNVKEISISSLFFQFVGLCIVGYGIEATPFGRRLAYLLLRSFGGKPGNILAVFLISSAVLSSFLSNTATVIIMAALCHEIMQEMGELPGKSRFAAACMLASVIGPSIGCNGFIQGSIGINVLAVNQLNSASGGTFSITPGQWSIAGWLSLMFLLPAAFLIIRRFSGFRSADISIPSRSYFAAQLHSMGKMSGSEIRWVIYVIALIGLMVAGFDTITLMLIFTVLCIFPGIGIMDAKTAFTKAVHWEVVFCAVTMSMIGTIFSNSGLSDVLSLALVPLLGKVSPLLTMFLLALLFAAISMFLIGTCFASVAIGVTMMTPIIQALGLNPAIMLIPVMFSINYMFGWFSVPLVVPNYQYGYWKKKEITIIGSAVVFAAVIINCLTAYFLLPTFWGVRLWL